MSAISAQYALKQAMRRDGHKSTEELHTKLLADVKIREKCAEGGYKFLSLVKEIDPMMKEPDLRAEWRYVVYDIHDSMEYTDPRLGVDRVARNRLYKWFEQNIPDDSTISKQIIAIIQS